MKGIDFIVIYTFLIVFFFFIHTSPLLHFIVLFAMILMWILGMVDGYIDEEMILRGMIWPKMMDIFSGSIITIAVGTIIFVGMHNFSSSEKSSVDNESAKATQVNQNFNNPEITAIPYQNVETASLQPIETNQVEQNSKSPEITQSAQSKAEEVKEEPSVTQSKQNIVEEIKGNPASQQQASPQSQREKQFANTSKPDQIIENKVEKAQSERYFVIQVGAFSKKISAESLADQLRKNNYTVDIIEPKPDENPMMYKVRVGKFETKDNAKKTAQELESKNLNIKAMILSF
jgi:cell division septation protein DedD